MDSKERNTEKHRITSEELDFLINLQKEMNTQDTICQADPRFWVVQQQCESVVPEGYEDKTVVLDTHGDYDTVAEDIDEFIQYIKENFIEEDQLDNYVFENDSGFYNIYTKNSDYDPEKDNEWDKYNEEYEDMYELEDVITCFEELGVISKDRFTVSYLKTSREIVPNTFFLTNKECKKHIELNNYHYDKPRSYAMTAWRSPEVEKLWDILQKVDWTSMKEE